MSIRKILDTLSRLAARRTEEMILAEQPPCEPLGIFDTPPEPLAVLHELSRRFSGFSLERRREWSPEWRVRVLPNKQERQHYRITAHGATPEEALSEAWEIMRRLDEGG